MSLRSRTESYVCFKKFDFRKETRLGNEVDLVIISDTRSSRTADVGGRRVAVVFGDRHYLGVRHAIP
jgi:hypothetical protein